jgi:hypothetical protein
MNRIYTNLRMIVILAPLVVLFVFTSIMSPMGAIAGVDSGLGINIYSQNDNQIFGLTSPIPITLVIENISPWKISTRRLFSQTPFHEQIILTGPNGEAYKPEKESSSDEMPPPVFWSDGKKTRELIPAELLEKGWATSVVIDDLRELFPVMGELPGHYTIDLHQPFVRFAWTMELESDGLMGVVDDRNWTGAVASDNRIDIYISPGNSARFRVKVEDLSSGNAVPVGMNQVRIYEGIISDFDDTWKKAKPVVAGTTGFDGKAVWDSGDPCLSFGEYTAVTRYKNEYGYVLFDADNVDWQVDCLGKTEKTIQFGKRDERFSVYATNSAWIRNNATVFGGNIGAPDPSEGPWLSGKVELDIGENVVLESDVKIMGHRVALSSSSVVNDVYYEEALTDPGATIRGVVCHPFDIVSEDCLAPSEWEWHPPALPPICPDGDKKHYLTVSSDVETVLPDSSMPLPTDTCVEIDTDSDAIRYHNVYLEPGARLRLTGGVYHFMNLYVGSNARVLCDDYTEIRIQERLQPGSKSIIGISSEGTSKGLSAGDVVIYVHGQNGKKGLLNSVPEAAVIGEGSTVKANIYVPNGTLRIKEGCDITGSFIAEDVAIGQKAKVYLDSYFQQLPDNDR